MVVILVHGQTDLPQVVGALGASGRFRAAGTAGSRIAITSEMMAITTRSSTRVNPRRRSSSKDLLRLEMESDFLDGGVLDVDRQASLGIVLRRYQFFFQLWSLPGSLTPRLRLSCDDRAALIATIVSARNQSKRARIEK